MHYHLLCYCVTSSDYLILNPLISVISWYDVWGDCRWGRWGGLWWGVVAGCWTVGVWVTCDIDTHYEHSHSDRMHSGHITCFFFLVFKLIYLEVSGQNMLHFQVNRNTYLTVLPSLLSSINQNKWNTFSLPHSCLASIFPYSHLLDLFT